MVNKKTEETVSKSVGVTHTSCFSGLTYCAVHGSPREACTRGYCEIVKVLSLISKIISGI